MQDKQSVEYHDDIFPTNLREANASRERLFQLPGYSDIGKIGSITKISRRLAPLILMIVDYGVILLAILGSIWFRNFVIPDIPFVLPNRISIQLICLCIPFCYIGLISYEGLYLKRLPFWQSAEKLFKISFFATGFIVGIMFFTGVAKMMPRILILAEWLLSGVFLILAHYVIKRLLVICGIWKQPIVVVGAGKATELLVKAFADEPGMGYQIVGIIEEKCSFRKKHHQYPLIGSFENLEEAIIGSQVSEVIIALPELGLERLLSLVYRIQPLVEKLTIVPDLQGLPLSNLELETYFDQKTVLLRVRNNLKIQHNLVMKRFFDLIVGTIIFICAIPFLLVIALLVKLDSPGPILHNGKRIGKKNREFKCYKFRTMFTNEADILEEHLADNPEAKAEWELFAKLKLYDPRVTQVGKWLRKFSLDELPQIFNVLKGEMSLVGPRPYLPRERERMTFHGDIILETVPGITGLWQVRGRNNIEFEGRLSLDSWYVRNWSLWLDISLLIRTITVVLDRKGAF
jgi:Undecaprenyl-phosphate galactose phosphotransferase WbaP